jgi:hypothetical protein
MRTPSIVDATSDTTPEARHNLELCDMGNCLISWRSKATRQRLCDRLIFVPARFAERLRPGRNSRSPLQIRSLHTMLIYSAKDQGKTGCRRTGLDMERETGIGPATNSLEGCDSTIELLPPVFFDYIKAPSDGCHCPLQDRYRFIHVLFGDNVGRQKT